MKKILLSLLLIAGCVIVARADYNCYSANISTYCVTDSSTSAAAQISGYARIGKILVSNSDNAIAQTVTFYNEGNSTTTVTAAFSYDVAISTYSGGNPLQIGFETSEKYRMHNMLMRKSSTSSNIKATIWYD